MPMWLYCVIVAGDRRGAGVSRAAQFIMMGFVLAFLEVALAQSRGLGTDTGWMGLVSVGVLAVSTVVTLIAVGSSTAWALRQPNVVTREADPSFLSRGASWLLLVILAVYWLRLAVSQAGERGRDWSVVLRGNSGNVFGWVFVILAMMAAVLYVSHLIDQCYVIPRLEGRRNERGDMPCTPSADWGAVTRIWIAHRAAAWFSFVLGGVIIVLLLISLASRRPAQSFVFTAVAAAATILAGFYLVRLATAIAFIQNGAVRVGDVVSLAEEYKIDDEVAVPRLYYVVDVALEGFKLAAFPPRLRFARRRSSSRTKIARRADEYPELSDPTVFRPPQYERMLDINDINRLLRSRTDQKPCGSNRAGDCTMINPYCWRTRRALSSSNLTDPPSGHAEKTPNAVDECSDTSARKDDSE